MIKRILSRITDENLILQPLDHETVEVRSEIEGLIEDRRSIAESEIEPFSRLHLDCLIIQVDCSRQVAYVPVGNIKQINTHAHEVRGSAGRGRGEGWR